MKIKICLECGKHNLAGDWSCVQCGRTLAAKTLVELDDALVELDAETLDDGTSEQRATASPATTETSQPGIASPHEPSILTQARKGEHAPTYAPSVYASSGYAALRGIASLCTGVGYVILGLAGLGAFGGLLVLGDSAALGLAVIVLSVITGGLSFVLLRLIAEGTSVLLDVEANTRQAAINTQRVAAILEQRLK